MEQIQIKPRRNNGQILYINKKIKSLNPSPKVPRNDGDLKKITRKSRSK